MSQRKKETVSKARQAVASLSDQLASLRAMTVGELREKYLEVFGEPSRSRNRDYLRKKIAWRIQELKEGGMSGRALARIAELSPTAPARWQTRLGDISNETLMLKTAPAEDSASPEPGTVLVREHKGIEHKVTVLEEGFEYQGRRYGSLSKIATEITGTKWNGHVFFHLKSRGKKRDAPGVA